MISSEFKDNISGGDFLINGLECFQPGSHEVLVLLVQMQLVHSTAIQPASNPLAHYDSRGAEIVEGVLENRGQSVRTGSHLGLVRGDPIRVDFTFYNKEHLRFCLTFKF